MALGTAPPQTAEKPRVGLLVMSEGILSACQPLVLVEDLDLEPGLFRQQDVLRGLEVLPIDIMSHDQRQ